MKKEPQETFRETHPIHPIEHVIGELNSFFKKIFFYLNEYDLNIEGRLIDHICYRVSSFEEYEKKKCEIAQYGTLLAETLVNGRAVSTYKLHQPIKYLSWKIPMIELPAPKTGKYTKSGLEHFEVVIPEGLSSFIKQHPNVPFNIQSKDLPLNPDIEIKFENYAVKFHPLALDKIISIEKNLNEK